MVESGNCVLRVPVGDSVENRAPALPAASRTSEDARRSTELNKRI
jgi:hypothetical protein